jgi:hypothetical protein
MTHYTAQDNNQGLVRGQQANQSDHDRVRIIPALSFTCTHMKLKLLFILFLFIQIGAGAQSYFTIRTGYATSKVAVSERTPGDFYLSKRLPRRHWF